MVSHSLGSYQATSGRPANEGMLYLCEKPSKKVAIAIVLRVALLHKSELASVRQNEGMSAPLPSTKASTGRLITYPSSKDGSLWLDKAINRQAPATGKQGRQPTFSYAAIQFCLTIKCIFGLALRQATGMVERMLRLAGLDWAVTDLSALSRRPKDLQVSYSHTGKAGVVASPCGQHQHQDDGRR